MAEAQKELAIGRRAILLQAWNPIEDLQSNFFIADVLLDYPEPHMSLLHVLFSTFVVCESEKSVDKRGDTNNPQIVLSIERQDTST